MGVVSDWVIVLGLASMSFVTTATGFLLASRLGDRPALTSVAVGFSAGIMVAVSIWQLLPEALSEAPPATGVIAATFGGALLGALHLAIPHTHLIDEYSGTEAAQIRTIYLVMFGLVLHDVPEAFRPGVVMAARVYPSGPSPSP